MHCHRSLEWLQWHVGRGVYECIAAPAILTFLCHPLAYTIGEAKQTHQLMAVYMQQVCVGQWLCIPLSYVIIHNLRAEEFAEKGQKGVH